MIFKQNPYFCTKLKTFKYLNSRPFSFYYTIFFFESIFKLKLAKQTIKIMLMPFTFIFDFLIFLKLKNKILYGSLQYSIIFCNSSEIF